MTANPIDGFSVSREQVRYVGTDLQRPECVLAERDGSLWAADARGGVVHIRPDGTQTLVTQSVRKTFASAQDEARRFTEGTLPNGLAFARDGSLLISNFGTDRLELMTRDGATSVVLDQIDGRPIGKVNFVLRDSKDRLWITVSTQIKNWMEAMSPRVCDGSIILVDGNTVRTVATDLAFTNEVRLDAKEERLYVVETTGRHITRFRVGEDGSLSEREIFGPADHNAFIDGIAFDAYGNLWGTHILTDRVFALTPEGELRIILDDDNAEASARLMEAFHEDRLTPDVMLATGGAIGPWFASVTFGGPDLRNVYIGLLRGTSLPWFRSPVAGLPMVHW